MLLAPIEVAQVQSISVRRGDRVEAGAPVAEMETDDAMIAVAQAEAALAQAQAQLADLQIGKRPEEIAVLDAMMRSAEAQASEKRRVLARATDLLKRGIATQAEFDEAKTAVEVAEARINQAEANLAVGNLPARPETIKAAENQVKQAGTALEQAHWRLAKRTLDGAVGGPHRRRDPQSRRPRRAIGAGHLDAAGRRGQADALRAGSVLLRGHGRQRAQRALRRLPGWPARRASATSRPTRSSRRR